MEHYRIIFFLSAIIWAHGDKSHYLFNPHLINLRKLLFWIEKNAVWQQRVANSMEKIGLNCYWISHFHLPTETPGAFLTMLSPVHVNYQLNWSSITAMLSYFGFIRRPVPDAWSSLLTLLLKPSRAGCSYCNSEKKREWNICYYKSPQEEAHISKHYAISYKERVFQILHKKIGKHICEGEKEQAIGKNKSTK